MPRTCFFSGTAGLDRCKGGGERMGLVCLLGRRRGEAKEGGKGKGSLVAGLGTTGPKEEKERERKKRKQAGSGKGKAPSCAEEKRRMEGTKKRKEKGGGALAWAGENVGPGLQA